MAFIAIKFPLMLPLVSLAITFVTGQDSTGGESKIVTLAYSIFEESPAFTFVGNVGTDITSRGLVDALSAEQLSQLTFSVSRDSALADYFMMEAGDGVLRTQRRINRDNICPQKETCFVELGIGVLSEPDFFEVISVKVTIDDMNDNPPKFLNEEISKSIPENTQVGTSISLNTADDLDSPNFGIKMYELITNTPDFELKVADDLQAIYLVVKNELDREQKDSYRIVIAAFDGGQPAKSGTLTINLKILDVNDNHPEFTNETYVKTIKENFDVANIILRVAAIDADSGPNGEIWYGFSAKTKLNHGDMFWINNSTGDIGLRKNLDYEQVQVYTLLVTASEKNPDAIPAEAKVVIHVEDVNDHPPQITINRRGNDKGDHISISESATVGQFVVHIKVSDPDLGEAGKFSCNLESSLTNNVFEIQKLYSSEFKLVTSAALDRELMPEYDMNFVCSDKGTPSLQSSSPIHVKISDENDNIPRFSHQTYSITLNENNAPGRFVVQVNAIDHDEGDNGDITYVLNDEARQYLSVDPGTGNITAKVSFDYELTQTLSLTVMAIDRGHTPQTSSAKVDVIITDLNDEAPEFSLEKYTFRIDENDAIGQEIGQVSASDLDSPPYNEFNFAIDESTPYADAEAFAIDSNSGKIYTRLRLDREQKAGYSLVIRATDNNDMTLFSTATVSIYVTDKNDNRPEFAFPSLSNNTITVAQDVSGESPLARIQAVDADTGNNGRLSYSIKSGNENDMFVLEKETGYLMFSPKTKSIPKQVFRLVLTVTDHGNLPLTEDANLNVVVNKTLSIDASQQLIPGGNLTIVITVAVISGILTVILIVAIVVMCRHQGRKNYLKKLLLASNGGGLVKGQDKSRDSDESLDSIENKKNKKEVSFSNEVEISDEIYPPGYNYQYEMQQGPVYNTSHSSAYVSRQPKKQPCSHANTSHHDIQLQPQAVQNNYLAMPPLHHENNKDPDSDSAHSEDLSNTDSGRGSNEDAEAALQHNSDHNHGYRGAPSRRPPTSPAKSNNGPGNFKHQLSSVVQGQREYLDDRSNSNGYSGHREQTYRPSSQSSVPPHPLPPREPINNNKPYSSHRPLPSSSSGNPRHHSHQAHRGRDQQSDRITLDDNVYPLTPSHV